MTSTSSPGRRRFPLALPAWTELRRAIADGRRARRIVAVIATVFVFRETYDKSVAAAVSRIGATLASFALCLVYLAFLPFHLWGLAVLTGLSGLAAAWLARRAATSVPAQGGTTRLDP